MLHLYENISHKSKEGLPLKLYKTPGVYLHWHSEYEFLLLEKGQARCTVNGEQVELTPNTAVLLQGGDLHAVRCDAGSAVTAIVVSPHFWAEKPDTELFDGALSFAHVFHADDAVGSTVLSALKQIVALYHGQGFGYEFMLRAKFAEIFATLLENGCYVKGKKQSRRLPDELRALLDHIHTNYLEKITLETLSSISFYSPTYIIKLFKKYTNLTPAEYVIQYRLSHALKKLQSGAESNLAIALSCGFHSESYFIRTFKKHYGITPHAYRARYGK